MRKLYCFLCLCLIFPILAGCGSDSGPDKSGMRAAIQLEADDHGYEGAKWPWGDEDYHFEKQDDGNYTSEGTFKLHGKSYYFSAEVDPDTDGVLDFYAEEE